MQITNNSVKNQELTTIYYLSTNEKRLKSEIL